MVSIKEQMISQVSECPLLHPFQWWGVYKHLVLAKILKLLAKLKFILKVPN